MITRIEALNYRCLRHISQPLGPFQVLVGPNASGKTTFLDVVAFLARLVSDGPVAAIGERTENLQDLVWGRSGSGFELGIEASIPDQLRMPMNGTYPGYDTLRYGVSLTLSDTEDLHIGEEQVSLVKSGSFDSSAMNNASSYARHAELPAPSGPDEITIVDRAEEFAMFRPEVSASPVAALVTSVAYSFLVGRGKSALGNLPEDRSAFPVTTWFRALLTEGVQPVVLNAQNLRKASPPNQGIGFKPDGSNLPWVVENLKKKAPKRFRDWIDHVRTALPDLEDIRTVLRHDDRHRYLMLRYQGGLEVPSWMASDGTLRLLALTLPAYLPDFEGIFLIEEPEDGIHPRAVETVVQSLSSVYSAQVLLATHSPVILSMVEPGKVLCFTRTPDGASEIVLGSEHPMLRDWHGQPNLSVLFAGGVLG